MTTPPTIPWGIIIEDQNRRQRERSQLPAHLPVPPPRKPEETQDKQPERGCILVDDTI